MPSRARYLERKEAGVCVTCGTNPADTANDRVRCVECSKRDADLRKDARDSLISEGVCPRCRKRKTAKERTLCKKCLANEAARYVARKPAVGAEQPARTEPVVVEPAPIAAPKPKRVRKTATTTPAKVLSMTTAAKTTPMKGAASKGVLKRKRAKGAAKTTAAKKSPAKARKRK